jgi:phosphate transport system substrate-binding protein
VIDKARIDFLDFVHFVVRRHEPILLVLAFPPLVVFALLGLAGCARAPQTGGAVEDSLTSGRISVVCAHEAYRLVEHERRAFQSHYPRAHIEVRPGSSQQAIAALFGATCDLAVITRDLEPEERRAAVQGKLALDGYRFAQGAIVVVVHRSNPVENMTIEDVRRIYKGEVTEWSRLNGPKTEVVPVIQPVDSDISGYFSQGVMDLEPIQARVQYASNDSEVVAKAGSDPGAVGYVALGTPLEGVRALRLATMTGLPYWKPDLEAIYQGNYPLTRYYSMYVRTTAPRLANGFVTFVTSYEGQRIVRDQGLVPTEVPVRFVRRSPMLGSH